MMISSRLPSLMTLHLFSKEAGRSHPLYLPFLPAIIYVITWMSLTITKENTFCFNHKRHLTIFPHILNSPNYTENWVDGVYEYKFPISRFFPIFLWQTVANVRFLWVNISWYLYCNIFQLFWRENSNDILVEMVMCDIRNGIKHKKLWLLHGRESRFDP